MNKISLVITHYNRPELLTKSFAVVKDDERISEIIISDDCSEDSDLIREQLHLLSPKIKASSNVVNIGMARNKAHAINLASNDWCILLDSDNIIDRTYIDALYRHKWDPTTIYQPVFAKPHFDFRAFSSMRITGKSIKHLSKKKNFDALINACNYFVNRDSYLELFEYNQAMKGTDTAWFLYLWLKSGYSMFVVPNMTYFHLVHDGSEFLKDLDYNMQKAKEMREMILSI